MLGRGFRVQGWGFTRIYSDLCLDIGMSRDVGGLGF